MDSDPDHGPYAELAHEALISGWERLAAVVNDNADFHSWLDRVRLRAARCVDEDGRVDDSLPEAGIAEALRLAADAELALRRSTAVALALATESVLTTPTLQGDMAVRHVLRRHPRTLARLDHDGPVGAVAFSPDGGWVATGSRDGSARVFEALPELLVCRALTSMSRPLSAAELRQYSLAADCGHVARWRSRDTAVTVTPE